MQKNRFLAAIGLSSPGFFVELDDVRVVYLRSANILSKTTRATVYSLQKRISLLADK